MGRRNTSTLKQTFACTSEHHPLGPEAIDAPTMELAQSMYADLIAVLVDQRRRDAVNEGVTS